MATPKVAPPKIKEFVHVTATVGNGEPITKGLWAYSEAQATEVFKIKVAREQGKGKVFLSSEPTFKWTGIKWQAPDSPKAQPRLI